jgi:hypothetical protein
MSRIDVERTSQRPARALKRDRGARGCDAVTTLQVNWRLGWLAAEMRPKFIPRMTVRKRRKRFRRFQKAAERAPTLGYIEDKQTLCRDRIADFLVVPTIGGYRAGAVCPVREGVFMNQPDMV